MLPVVVFLIQRIEDDLQVLFIAQEIGIAGIYKQGFDIVLLDIVGIGFLDIEQIIIRDILLIRPVPLFDIGLQPGYRCMQVYQDIWLYKLLVDDVEQALVQPELIIGQGYLGKQQAFGKQVIGNGEVLKHVLLLQQVLLLLVPLGHKKELEGKCILRRVFIKFRQERIVRKFLQHQPRIVMLAQQVGQGGLAGPDISFNGNKIIFHAARSCTKGQNKEMRQ